MSQAHAEHPLLGEDLYKRLDQTMDILVMLKLLDDCHKGRYSPMMLSNVRDAITRICGALHFSRLREVIA
jgi:hypothetical protein